MLQHFVMDYKTICYPHYKKVCNELQNGLLPLLQHFVMDYKMIDLPPNYRFLYNLVLSQVWLIAWPNFWQVQMNLP